MLLAVLCLLLLQLAVALAVVSQIMRVKLAVQAAAVGAAIQAQDLLVAVRHRDKALLVALAIPTRKEMSLLAVVAVALAQWVKA